MSATSTPSSSGNLNLSFIKSLFGSSTISTPTTTTATTTKDVILNQTPVPTTEVVSQQHKDQQIQKPQSQSQLLPNEMGMEKQQKPSAQQSLTKQHDFIEQQSLPQEQHKRLNIDQNLVHGQHGAPPMPLLPTSQHLRSRKKEGKRQRLNRQRQKRKAMGYENFDNNIGKKNDDLDFDGLLALHETKTTDTKKLKNAKTEQSTTNHPVTVSTTSHLETTPLTNSSWTPFIDQSLGLQTSSTQANVQQSSAINSDFSISTKKSDISTQEAAFLSNVWDSLSKGNDIPKPLPPPPQQNGVNKQQTKNGHQSNPNQKQQASAKRKNGKGTFMTKKQKVNTGNVGTEQLANGKPSMTDIAHDILGKPRHHLHQKHVENQSRKKGGQHQDFNNHQIHQESKQQLSPSNSGNNINEKTSPTPMAICKYYIRGNCTQGDSCKFKHEGKQQQILCKFYKSGSCANGDNCTFSHDLQLEPCRFFFVGGSCDAGDHCVFSHAPLTDDSRKELHKMTGPCRFYHFKGYCANGNECVFAHTEIADDKRQELERTLTPCKHFHMQQVCPRGDDCFYLHEEAPPESVRLFKEMLSKQQNHQHRPVTKQPSSSKQLVSPPVAQNVSPHPPPRLFSNQNPPIIAYSKPGLDPRLTRPLPYMTNHHQQQQQQHPQYPPSSQNYPTTNYH